MSDGSRASDRGIGVMAPFSTPAPLNRKFNVPSRLDKRWGLGDTKDIVQICEEGVSKSIKAFGREILTEIRNELRQNMDMIRVDIHNTMESLESARDDKFAEVLGQLAKLYDVAISPQNVDFSSIYDKFASLESLRSKCHTELLNFVQTKLADSVSSVLTNSNGAQQRLESRSEALRADIIRLQKVVNENHSALVGQIEHQFVEYARSSGVNVRFDEVLGVAAQNHFAVTQQFYELFIEISKIEEALNVDFKRVRGEIRSMTKFPNTVYTEPEFEMCLPEYSPPTDIDRRRMTYPSTNHYLPCRSDGMETDRSESPAVSVVKAVMNSFHASHAFSSTRSASPVTLFDAPILPTTPSGDVYKVQRSLIHNYATRRYRNAVAQTATVSPVEKADQNCQTEEEHVFERVEFKRQKSHRGRDHSRSKKDTKPAEKNAHEKAVMSFSSFDNVKARMRTNFVKPQYNVMDYYHTQGRVQRIARHPYFENFTFYVIALNTLWFAVDTDYNKASVLIEADSVFQVMENVFCAYFVAELTIRFWAFQNKSRAFRDAWFVFDFLLVVLMVAETWVVSLVMVATGLRSSTGLSNASLARMLRLVRLVRLTRLAKFMQSVPELLIICKGIGYASRSVLIFFCMWFLIIYVFAVVLRQLLDLVDSDVSQKYSTVPIAMNTLLLEGVFPDFSRIVYGLTDASWLFWPLIIFFIALASVTLMYMLVGVLVDVVRMVAETEKEGLSVSYLATQLRANFAALGRDTTEQLSKREFEQLMKKEQIARTIQSVGVDVVNILDSSELIFDEIEKNDDCGMTFEKLVSTILDMRDANPTRVKDSNAQLKILKGIIKDSSQLILDKLTESVLQISTDVRQLRGAFEDGSCVGGSELDSDDDSDRRSAEATSTSIADSPA